MPKGRFQMTDASMGETLARICVEAGHLILPYWRSGTAVMTKSDESPVTVADQLGEKLILERLLSAFPDVPVISEEDASEFGTPDAIGPRFFLVDPLDGTKAFVRGDPNFTVNIGLVQDRRPVAGAVYAPVTEELWWTTAAGVMRTVKGGAAEQVRVRAWPNGEAVALISHTMKPETTAKLAAEYGFHQTSPMDSSIKFCRIAEGAADIYPRHGPTMEWDTCAGHAVLEAAGGSVLTPDGQPYLYGKADEGFRNGWFVARGG
jgi:3'(2'), 5'-bisphosphate nucleotidase